MTTPPPAKRPRVKCPRCGKRRTMQTALKWRRTPEDEFAPVCGECWSDLFIAAALYAEAVMTPGLRLCVEREAP